MADGLTFDRAGMIRPGWELIVPEPPAAIQTDGEGQRWYTVRKGDSLAGISARLLGTEQRLPELYAANEGVRLDDRRVLQDPRLIWPGLVLRVPELDVQPSPTPQAPPESDASQPVPPPPTQVVPATPTVVVGPTAPPAPLTAPVPMPTPAPEPEDAAAATREVGSGPTVPDATDRAPVGTPQPSAARQVPNRLVPPAVGGAAEAAAAIAGVSGAALVLRRRHPRPGRTQPESDVAVNAGYAEVEPVEESGPGAECDDLNTAAAIAARMSQEVAAVLLR
jgi:LysM domain